MFCSKCGAQITGNDKICPKCGAVNINHVEPHEKKISVSKFSKFANMHISGSTEEGKKLKPIKYVAFAGVAIVVIGLVISFSGVLFRKDKVTYSQWGLTSYQDSKQNIYFLNGKEVVSFNGPAASGKSTPDHSKYLVLYENKKLIVHGGDASEEIVVSDNATRLGGISDKGCFYYTGKKEHLLYYDFAKAESIDIGYEEMETSYSAGNKSVIALNDKGELFSFSTSNMKSKTLCNAGSDASVCCIADDGSNVIWSVKNGNTYSVYMLKNGVPERIGKIANSNKYSYCYGYFFNDDKSFVIYSNNSTQMILCNNGEIIEITLPGVKAYSSMVNEEGLSIDSDDDNINSFYFAVANIKDSDYGSIYKMSCTGELVLEADDVNLNGSYYVCNKRLYYINKDNDFMRKTLGNDTTDLISTDVTNIYVSSMGKYVYMVKSGGLYYWNTSDKNFKLILFSSAFTPDDEFYLTDKDETVFYISDMKEIKDSYLNKGTVYQHTVGQKSVKIADDIIRIISSDTEYINAEAPLFIKYISNEKYDHIVEYGSIDEGNYKMLISNIIY